MALTAYVLLTQPRQHFVIVRATAHGQSPLMRLLIRCAECVDKPEFFFHRGNEDFGDEV